MKGALLTVGAGPVAATLGVAILAGGVAPSPVQASQASTTAGNCLLSSRDGHFSARLEGDEVTNAATIDAVGRNLDIPTYGEVIALATALQESGLRNLTYGDRDSLGLFQQRPSQGWGTPEQVLDPVYAATQFYRHLQAIPEWPRLSLTVAAQAVQHSAYPDAYAKWQSEGATLDGALMRANGSSLNCQR
jgi:hypothetical protein